MMSTIMLSRLLCPLLLLASCTIATVSAWVTPSSLLVINRKSSPVRARSKTVPSCYKNNGDGLHFAEQDVGESSLQQDLASSQGKNDALVLFATMVAATMVVPEPAFASNGAPSAVASALVAYGHYLAFLVMTACVTVERFTIQPDMSDEEEDRIALADIIYGLSGLLLTVTGYFRVVQYGKGWDFYSHEPLFWLKISLVGVAGALSFFNTITIFQRSIAKRNGELVPMSPQLAKRMNQICNAELSAYVTIPLAATFMSRGVGYAQDVPWQIGAVLSLVVFGGASYKYVKEALEWKEENVEMAALEE